MDRNKKISPRGVNCHFYANYMTDQIFFCFVHQHGGNFKLFIRTVKQECGMRREENFCEFPFHLTPYLPGLSLFLLNLCYYVLFMYLFSVFIGMLNQRTFL